MKTLFKTRQIVPKIAKSMWLDRGVRVCLLCCLARCSLEFSGLAPENSVGGRGPGGSPKLILPFKRISGAWGWSHVKVRLIWGRVCQEVANAKVS